MAPKKCATKAKAEAQPAKPADTEDASGEQNTTTESAPMNGDTKDEHTVDEPTPQKQSEAKPSTTKESSKKRKKAPDQHDDPQKAPRRSGRGALKSEPSQHQLLNYMLSKDAEELCRPDDETEDVKSRGDIRTYSSSALNPFEELLCAVILSRPISHRLGVRAIRTILNDPYNFTSAKAVQAAGKEKHHQALWDARTQHKAKTAEEIGLVADVVLDKFTKDDDEEGTNMQKIREDCNRDVPKEREYMKSSIKGLGKTGLDIFFRRVQWIWDAGYPFVDDRTRQSLRKLGLPEEGQELEKLMGELWSKLETDRLAGDDEAAKKRRAFVTLLERATGSDLEGKQDALLQAAAAS